MDEQAWYDFDPSPAMVTPFASLPGNVLHLAVFRNHFSGDGEQQLWAAYEQKRRWWEPWRPAVRTCWRKIEEA